MELRKDLMPPRVKRGQVRHLTRLAELIVDELERGTIPRSMIEEFNQRTDQKFGPIDFLGAAGSSGLKAFVERLTTIPAAGKLNISDEEFLEIIRRLKAPTIPKAHHEFWLKLLNLNLPHPAIQALLESDRTPEQVLAEAKTYKTISLS